MTRFLNGSTGTQVAPSSPWLEQALLYVGNIYLSFVRIMTRPLMHTAKSKADFPGRRASVFTLESVVAELRQGRDADAKADSRRISKLVRTQPKFPRPSTGVDAWPKKKAMPPWPARFIRKFLTAFEIIIMDLLHGALEQVKVTDPPHYAILDHVSPINGIVDVTDDPPPKDALRVEKARLLENRGLPDFALRELKAAADEYKGTGFLQKPRACTSTPAVMTSCRDFETRRAERFCHLYEWPAAVLSGSAVSETLLAGSETFFRCQWARPVIRSHP